MQICTGLDGPRCRPRCALSGVHRTGCAVIGAAFIPLLALGLLIMNGRAEWVGDEFRNHRVTNIVLLIILGFFAWIAWQTLVSQTRDGSTVS